ncbi:MAG: hypothetical protein ABIB97_01975 [Patescibacteria group bacterium]
MSWSSDQDFIFVGSMSDLADSLTVRGIEFARGYKGQHISIRTVGQDITTQIGNVTPRSDDGKVEWHFHPRGELVISGDSFQLIGDIPESFRERLESLGMGLEVGPGGHLLWVFQGAGDVSTQIGTITPLPNEGKVDIKICPEGQVLVRPELALKEASTGQLAMAG